MSDDFSNRKREFRSEQKPRAIDRRVRNPDFEYFDLDTDDNTMTPRFAVDLSVGNLEPLWDDLRFPATAINPPGAASDPDWDSANGGWLFAASGTETLFLIAQLPHTWKQETDLEPHVHWEKTTSATGNVRWVLRYEWAPIGEVRSSLLSLASSTTSVSDNDTANTHAITDLGTIDASGKGISDMLMMRLDRTGSSGADTYGADARLLEFDIHYQKDSLGSRGEFTK